MDIGFHAIARTAAIGLALSACSPVQQPRDAEAVAFTYSHEPDQVVLSVETFVPLSAVTRSMTLSGDGRLELLGRGPSLPPSGESHTLRLSEREVRDLLDEVVTSGVAEWDGAAIRARQREKTGGVTFSGADDAPTITVHVSLESLSKGGDADGKKGVETDFRLDDPGYAAKTFPDIQELQGVMSLMRYMDRAFARARSSDR